MKATVIEIFADKFTGQIYHEGEIIEFADKKRVEDLQNRNLIHVVEIEAEAEKTTTTKRRKNDRLGESGSK